MRRFAIGDVHGCVKTLKSLLDKTLQITRDDLVILLGDYVDRGPASREVLDLIEELISNGYRVIPLRGNHDDLLVRGRFSVEFAELHLRNGGGTTLKSFSVNEHKDIPVSYVDFVDSLPFYHLEPEYVFVHASLNVADTDPLRDLETMLWKRMDDDDRDHEGRRVVCGHTPQTLDEIRERIYDGRKIILDNGCVYSGRDGMGNLVAMDMDTMKLYAERNVDMNM